MLFIGWHGLRILIGVVIFVLLILVIHDHSAKKLTG